LKHQNIGYNKDWERTESIADILNNFNSNSAQYYNPNLSKLDIEYWNHANEESKRLEDNMTDAQKELLD
jgi:hypothetical protein